MNLEQYSQMDPWGVLVWWSVDVGGLFLRSTRWTKPRLHTLPSTLKRHAELSNNPWDFETPKTSEEIGLTMAHGNQQQQNKGSATPAMPFSAVLQGWIGWILVPWGKMSCWLPLTRLGMGPGSYIAVSAHYSDAWPCWLKRSGSHFRKRPPVTKRQRWPWNLKRSWSECPMQWIWWFGRKATNSLYWMKLMIQWMYVCPCSLRMKFFAWWIHLLQSRLSVSCTRRFPVWQEMPHFSLTFQASMASPRLCTKDWRDWSPYP